jgi:sulfur carrier protein ThiS
MLPGRVEEYVLEKGATVAQALDEADLDASGYQVRVNTEPATMDTPLKNGDRVLLVKQIKGN